MKNFKTGFSTSALALALAWTTGAMAQAQGGGASSAQVGAAPPPAEAMGEDIIVTAQKRSERLSNVPLTITAASAATLQAAGVTDTSSLAKIAPGFTATKTATAAPVYTLRGVGYFESSLAATPAVTVYVDQIPLTYPQMTRNAVFDLERVEVLKGPQGTLFGQNSTGGAINYIAAKPTNTLQAGFNVTGGSYRLVNADAFVSGSLSDTLRARIAVGHDSQDDWQQSYTRPGDTRGQVDIVKGRMLVDWTPAPKWSFTFGASGWIDRSDTQAAQLAAKTPNLPELPAFTTYPLAPQNARAADWSPTQPKARNDHFYQISLRANYAATDNLNLVSLTSYGKLKIKGPFDTDGTSLDQANYEEQGHVRSFNEELRAEVNLARTRAIVGANYSNDKAFQDDLLGVSQSSTAINSPPVPGGFPISQIEFSSNQKIQSYAGFVNVDQELTDTLKFQIAARYTESRKSFSGCGLDVGNGLGKVLQFIANLNRLVLPPLAGTGLAPVFVAEGACFTVIDSQYDIGLVNENLNEHNLSFRVGPSWKVTPDTLLYANVSRGYKAGTFPSLGAVNAAEYNPTKQESVIAYEAGFKTALLNRTIQLSGAGFYYDYKNKQLLGTDPDPFFGPLQRLVNIPKSRIYGAELQVNAEPIKGLTLSGGVTYVNSKVTGSYVNSNPYGTSFDFKGSAFPFTPKWQATFNAQYETPMSRTLNVFIGGNALYNSKTFGAFGSQIPYNPTDVQHGSTLPFPPFTTRYPTVPATSGALDLIAYTTFDARVGVATADGTLRFTVWSRNLTNKYYWTTAAFIPADSTIRYAAMPRTFGATLAYRFGG